MIGVFNPLWWATDGWNIIEQDRTETIEKVIRYMRNNYNFDGMLANYPNGGLVLVLWQKYEKIPLKLK